MQCKKCKAEWKSGSVTSQLSACPFCGASLVSAPAVNDDLTMSDVMVQIVERFGEEIFSQERKCLAAFKDFAPTLEKEQKILKIAFGEGVAKFFLGCPVAERESHMQKARQAINDLLSDKASLLVVESFAVALGWNMIGKGQEHGDNKIKHQSFNPDGKKPFRILVLGEFSRGKSTFINALLGCRLLPASKNPTTAVISKIVYGETPEYIVHYKSGETKSISEDEFRDIKAPSEVDALISGRLKDKIKPIVKRQEKLDDIDYVEIRYPLPLCKNNVEVVDTPGTNDLNVERVNITYNYLRKADVVILVLWATQLLSKSELDFLREQVIGDQVNKISIVINGKDQCKTLDEEARVIQFVHDHLASVGSNDIKVFLLSSKEALAWKRKENGEELPRSTKKWLPDSLESTGFMEFEQALENCIKHGEA